MKRGIGMTVCRYGIGCLMVFGALVAMVGCDGRVQLPGKKRKPELASEVVATEASGEESSDALKEDAGLPGMDQIKTLYLKAKVAGENVPDDVMDWAKADLKKIGTWRYRVVTLFAESDETMQVKLQKLGDQRWECFWVEVTPGSIVGSS